jgi:hypothetical protein
MSKSHFVEAKACCAALDAEVSKCGDVLRSFPRDARGLTPDAVKFSPEYRTAKAASDNALVRLRTFNAWYVKTFKTELRAERRARKPV